jgi:hypothetical protein
MGKDTGGGGRNPARQKLLAGAKESRRQLREVQGRMAEARNTGASNSRVRQGLLSRARTLRNEVRARTNLANRLR